MRLLIVTGIYPPEIGGSATYSALLRRELPKRDIEAAVLTYGKVAPRLGSADKDYSSRAMPTGRQAESRDYHDIFYVSSRWPKGLRHFIFLIKLIRLGRKYDLILSADSSFGAATITALACRLTGKKFIVRVTGDYAWEQGMGRFGVKDLIDDFQVKKYGWRVSFLRWAQNFAVKNAFKVIAPSEYLKKIVVGWGAEPPKVEVIYNGTEFKDMSLRGTPKQSYLEGSLKKEFTIISAGRLVPWKGFPVLINAVEALLRRGVDAHLFIIGDGPERAKIERQIETSGFSNRIKLLGVLPKNELMKYLSESDVFVLNTAYEGFSHQIIEAMAMGAPVVTTPVGGNPEIIKDGENGLFFEYNNQDQLESVLERFYKDPGLRARLSSAGRETAKKFTNEAMLDKLTKIL